MRTPWPTRRLFPTSALGQATYGFTGREDQLRAAWEFAKHLVNGAYVQGDAIWYHGYEFYDLYENWDGSDTGRLKDASELAKCQELAQDALAHSGQSGWWDDACGCEETSPTRRTEHLRHHSRDTICG